MAGFAESVQLFVDKAKANANEVVRVTAFKILARLIQRSPVGNPELWASNQTAVAYNNAVSEHNAALRKDKGNLTKNGRLRKGLKVKDSMDVKSPENYTGGRFRGNWQVGFNSPPQGETGRVDKKGTETLADGGAILAGFKASDTQSIYFVNNVPYAVRLEFGHSKQAPRGMVRITAQEFQKLFNEAARGLNK